ncbi:hypothetical protein Ciccas_002527 [Cichlidogyrus casuarinus]|uniref:Tubby C-terminal domain-containing protein n=1 Tax=Cichlidogyrus casuarinus TaxID=1844966 RepID=A0ABD2QHL1_9PLAT
MSCKLAENQINGYSFAKSDYADMPSIVDTELNDKLEEIQIIKIKTAREDATKRENREIKANDSKLKNNPGSIHRMINQPVQINKSFILEDVSDPESTSLEELSTDSILIRRDLEEAEKCADTAVIRPAMQSEFIKIEKKITENSDRSRTDTNPQSNKIDHLQTNEDKNCSKTIASIDPTENLQSFVTSPAPQGVVIRCCITRHKDSIEKGFYPSYFLHLEREDNKKFFLLAAKRRKRSKTSSYLISVDAEDFTKEASTTMGKVKSNFLGTNYTGIMRDENSHTSEIVAVIFVRFLFLTPIFTN